MRPRSRPGGPGQRRRRAATHRGRKELPPEGVNGAIIADLAEDAAESPFGDIGAKTTEELRALAVEVGLKNGIPTRRSDLILNLLSHYAEQSDLLLGAGILDIGNDGYGFLRHPTGERDGQDIYVSQSQVRRFSLRNGDMIAGQVRAPKEGERYYGLVRVEIVNSYDPETSRKRPKFGDLTPLFPDSQIKLETTPKVLATRLIDLVAPIGRGQRALIVSPPKAGKTILLKQIADGITSNHPEIYLLVALIGERPEEVTDMRRSVEGEVFSSTFDEPVEDHCRAAEVALERAKRLVEGGEDVVILVDSLTRLARAYNLAVPSSGRTLSGGMDPIALYPPKRFFGAARNTEESGSLTIVATCLVDTNSRMDELIYEEFKGTGNMELHLDRRLADRRIYPSIDIQRSSTRREELLMDEKTLQQVWLVRRMMAMIGGNSPKASDATERLLERLQRTSNTRSS